MKFFEPGEHRVGTLSINPTTAVLFVAVSLAAIVGAFGLANTDYQLAAKIKGFAAIVTSFLLFCIVAFWRGGRSFLPNPDRRAAMSADHIERTLYSIEELGTYFGGSLKPADLFRLMSNRINDLLPFNLCLLLMVDPIASKMVIVHADGENAYSLRGREFAYDRGLAGAAISEGVIKVDRDLKAMKEVFPVETIIACRSSAALPLQRNGEVFAVLQFFSRARSAFDGDATSMIEAVGERVTPTMLTSMSFQQSLSNALTDPLTQLPNERAFFLVVENQIAESQRNRDGRPVSILALDIKYFSDVNGRFGHSTGDNLLNFVAQKIREQLRQMDFFARSSDDEFLVIMPTASAKIATEIVSRIETEFIDCLFSINNTQSVKIALNFGCATFGEDGETAVQLLAAARERKEQTKTSIPSKVVWFPKEYLN